MVEKFQVLLDGNYVQNPKKWEDIDTTIKRDDAIAGLLLSQGSELEFVGDGHDYIKATFDAGSFCGFIEVEIRQTCDNINYDSIFKGIIQLSDCKFYLETCTVSVKTIDDGYYARINNNRAIKAKLDVGRSKNDEDITAASSIAVEFFNPQTGVYDSVNKPHVFRVFEVFRFLVAFMTDGNVDFVSDDFDTGGDYEGQCITIGNEVRLYDQSVIPELSFEEVFTEVNKKNRIGFSVEKVAGRPTLRIERLEYFYGQSSAITLNNAKGAVMQMDVSQLYSQVHLGSSIVDEETPPVGEFPESIAFVGFKDETYHIIGTCNINNTLELSSEWIISSNIIESIFLGFAGADAYDEDIILVNVNINTNKAVQRNWLGVGTSVFYNEVFTNQNVVTRWLGGIPNSIAHFLGNDDDTFLATLTSDSGLFTASSSVGVDTYVQFDNDYTSPNHDVNNTYGNGTVQGNSVSLVNSRYTAPANGVYTFDVSIILQIIGYGDFACWGEWYDSSNTLISILTFGFLNNATGNQTLSGNFTANMATGDYVRIVVNYAISFFPIGSLSFYIKAGSTFACNATASGGGPYKEIDPEDYKIKKYSFSYPMTYGDLQTIKQDTKKLITFTTNNGVQQTGWISEIKYFHHNKPAEIVLISN